MLINKFFASKPFFFVKGKIRERERDSVSIVARGAPVCFCLALDACALVKFKDFSLSLFWISCPVNLSLHLSFWTLKVKPEMGKRAKKKNTGDLVVFNDDRHEDCEGAVRQYKPLPGRVEKGERF